MNALLKIGYQEYLATNAADAAKVLDILSRCKPISYETKLEPSTYVFDKRPPHLELEITEIEVITKIECQARLEAKEKQEQEA